MGGNDEMDGTVIFFGGGKKGKKEGKSGLAG